MMEGSEASRGVLLTTVLILLVAGPAMAQDRAPVRFGLGPVFGFQKAENADEMRPMAGAAARLRITPFLGAEGSITYRTERFRDGGIDVRSVPVQLTGLLYPVPVLYGAIGIGWHTARIEEATPPGASVTEREFGWHFGGGVEVPLGEVVSLTGDVRYVYLNYEFANAPGYGADVDAWFLTAGLLFGL